MKVARCIRSINIMLGDANGYCEFKFLEGQLYAFEDKGAYIKVIQEKPMMMTRKNFNILFDVVKEVE